MLRIIPLALTVFLGYAPRAMAADDSAHFDGARLGLFWIIPFIGMLLSIAIFPLLARRFWEHHFGKIALFWAAAFVLPFAIAFGAHTAATAALHTLVVEYLPFIILLFSLFVVAGGIQVVGKIGRAHV